MDRGDHGQHECSSAQKMCASLIDSGWIRNDSQGWLRMVKTGYTSIIRWYSHISGYKRCPKKLADHHGYVPWPCCHCGGGKQIWPDLRHKSQNSAGASKNQHFWMGNQKWRSIWTDTPAPMLHDMATSYWAGEAYGSWIDWENHLQFGASGLSSLWQASSRAVFHSSHYRYKKSIPWPVTWSWLT